MKKIFYNRRWLFIALVATAQLICLFAGAVWFASKATSRTKSLIRNQVLADNELLAGQFGQIIDSMQLRSIELSSAGWKQLQGVVEQIELPNAGFICITDAQDGRLLCHPKLRSNPKLASMHPGNVPFHTTDAAPSPMRQVAKSSQGPRSGWAQMQDGVHLISVCRLADLNANLSVHQREANVDAKTNSLRVTLRNVGLTVGCLIVVLSTLVSLGILRWFDTSLFRLNSQLEEQVRKRTQSLISTRNATIFGLAKLAESRDSDTGEHLDRIRNYVTVLARQLSRDSSEVDADFISNVAIASSLHDIGKVGIPDQILLKPGKLSQHERTLMQRHAILGGECLEAIELRLGDDAFLHMAQEIAISHHEKWDGTGYPYGLKGQAIPLSARIVAVADVYDALTSKRPYKPAFPHNEAKAIIVEGQGTHFDPSIVDAFLGVEEEFGNISNKVSVPETIAAPMPSSGTDSDAAVLSA